MNSGRSIQLWLLRHLSWLALTPVLAIGVALGAIIFPAVHEDIVAENHAFADAIAAEATLLLQDPATELELLAIKLSSIHERAEAEHLLSSAILLNTRFDAVYLADGHDRVIFSTFASSTRSADNKREMDGLDISGWPHIREVRERPRTVWSDTHLSTLSGQITMSVAVPTGDGKVLVGEVGLARLSNFAQRVGASGHVATVVLDRRGQVVAHPNPLAGLQQVNLSNLELVREGFAGKREPRRFELDGREYLGTTVQIPGPDWLVIVGQPVDQSRTQVMQTAAVMLFAMLSIGLLSWLLARRLARRLATPLAKLVAHAETVSSGDYGAAAPAMPWPELNRVRDAMSHMVHSIVFRERALLATEHRYRSLVDGMDDLIAQFDLEARFQFVNPASEQFFGLLPGACLGLSFFDLIHPEDRERVRHTLVAWIDSEDWQLRIETRLMVDNHPAGRALWSMSKEFDEEGALIGLRGIAHDVTEIRRSQDALRGLVAATARESGEEFFRSLVRHMARTLEVELAFVSERQADGIHMRTLAVWSGKAFLDNLSFTLTDTPCERLLKSDHGVLAETLADDRFAAGFGVGRTLRGFLGATLRDARGNGIGTLVLLAERELGGHADYSQLVSIFADRAAMELARQHSEAELRLAASVFQSSAEGILITDPGEKIISANSAVLPITGYTPAELVGNTPRLLRSGRHGPDFYDELHATLERDNQWTGEVWNRRKDGSVYPQWMTVTVVRDAEGRVMNYLSSFFDISARKEAEARIHFLAHHDALTGLPNRVLLQDRLNQAISIARRERMGVAVMFLDLDRFKLINDSLGHDFGDALLEQVALRITDCLREGETVARLGGDEFVVVLPHLVHSQDASIVASRILEAISQPVEVKGQSFHVTPSIGISVFPEDGDNVETLLRNADTAMYHAKEQGRNNFQFYTEALNAVVTERVLLENDMRRGLEQREFVVHYQPQVDARSGRVIGAEALVRWQHPQHGMISPARFIPVAEDTGLIVPLGEYVLVEACRQAVAWNQRFPQPIRMGVNLSARQFAMSNLLDSVVWAIESTGMRPDLLELELTESMLMGRPDEAAALLHRLSEIGIRLAIDDFGTGYSSLSYLRRFPIDRLKIDQSFIQDLSSDPNDAAIVRAVISLAHTLNLEVIAEGVETPEHLSQLREWGCFDVQGFLFSRPLTAAAFEDFCNQSAEAVQG